MCGIGAILDPAGSAGEHAVTGMVEALRHRGPDGQAVRRIGPLTLAHTRLAIIDVAGGDQPLDSEDGQVTAIVNGEIYNHRELRARLEAKGHRFATGSDSEVVVHAYEEHGPDLVKELNGIFAFALWDARARRLVAARDHFGVKPLYWWTRRAPCGARLRGGRPAGRRPGPGRGGPRGARPLPGVPVRARAADAVRRRPEAPAGVRADRGRGRAAARDQLPRGARPLDPRRRRRGPGARARRALRRRGQPADDDRRPLRRLPLRRRGLGRGGGRHGELRPRPADHVHDRLPGPRRPARRAPRRRRDGPPDRHRPPRHHDGRGRLPRRARALRAPARGALRHSLRPGAAPALALRLP